LVLKVAHGTVSSPPFGSTRRWCLPPPGRGRLGGEANDVDGQRLRRPQDIALIAPRIAPLRVRREPHHDLGPRGLAEGAGPRPLVAGAGKQRLRPIGLWLRRVPLAARTIGGY